MSNNHARRDLQLQQQTRDAGFARPQDVKRGEVVEVNGAIQGNLPYLIWVRPLETNASPIQMFNPGVVQNLQAGMTVFYRQEPEAPAPWSLVRFDNATYAQDAATFLSLPGANNPPHASEHIMAPGHVGPDPMNVYGHAIVDFAVRPTRPASMRVRVHPGWYPGATNYELFKGPLNTKDFSSDVPASTGKARLVAVCVDKAGVLTYVNGGEYTEGEPIPAAARPQVSTQLLLITAIRLVNGMTALKNEHFDHEMRPVFAPGGLSRSLDAAKVSKLVSPDGLIEPVIAADNNGDLTMLDGAAAPLVFADRSEAKVYFGRNSDGTTINNTAASIYGEQVLVMIGDGASAQLRVIAHNSNTQIRAYRAQGSEASPTALTSGNVGLRMSMFGYGATAWSTPRARMDYVTAENWTDTAQGTSIRLATTPNGTTTLTDRLTIQNSGRVDLFSATDAQLRLEYTRNSVYAAFTVDANHDLTIKPTSTGQIKLQPTTDSTDFFQVLDADGGTPILNVDATNEGVVFGSATLTYTEEGATVTPLSLVERRDVGAHRNMVFSSVAAGVGRAANNEFIRARVGPGALSDGDKVMSLFGAGHDGTDYNRSAELAVLVDGAVSANTVPMAFAFLTSATNSASLTERMRITSDGQVTIGTDFDNSKMNVGLNINPGSSVATTADFLALRDGAVAHGMTTIADTVVFGMMREGVSGGGELAISGLAENETALSLLGYGTGEDTTKLTSSTGAVVVTAAKASGTGLQAIGADGNLLVVTNNGTTRFIFDAEGDFHYDSTSTSFDTEDDVSLLRAITLIRDAPGIIRTEFDGWVRYKRTDLERLKLATFNDNDGSVFINHTAMAELHSGAIWQLHLRLTEVEAKLGG